MRLIGTILMVAVLTTACENNFQIMEPGRSSTATTTTTTADDPDLAYDGPNPTITDSPAEFTNSKPGFTWENPDHNDFDHVIIVRKADSASTDSEDGDEIYNGNDTTFQDDADIAEGEYYYTFYACDADGNCTEIGVAVSITYDITPPENATVTINDGDAYTNSVNVTLAISADDAINMAISNDSSFGSAEDYATSAAWDLTSGDGEKTVMV